ncbi:Putative peptidase S12 family protein [Kitasatospora sp. MMS16-BH015]|uniref:serine hydrolase domain-containing protein n=1 Tax=Kitasatospora sp. MMS16-BH015 TaxID=2018025 RepID=UPI000CA22643|nr:serine hydrolase domain-containing protein [Kitasatospora sp. MMS16-BH015]AUG81422.1 Putative peptidase S12 family protein [Kitasatospora sp. MMS16-BH015]
MDAFCGIDVAELLREYGVPGCSVAVLEGGEVVERRGFGVRSVGGGAVTGETLFQACSVSKPVSVLGVLRLVERGLLELDGEVDGRLVGWRLPANGGWRPRVTLRQLLSHTGGLSPGGFGGYPAGAVVLSLVEVLTGSGAANSAGVRAEGVPGLGFRYSGGGTTVLQLLLESVTGRGVTELLDELVLGPLRMVGSTFGQPLAKPYRPVAAHGHRAGAVPVAGGWHTYPEQCAAGLWTTPGDLLRYVRGVQVAWAGRGLLGPELAREMLRPQVALGPGGGVVGGLDHVGLGPYLRMVDGEPAWFGHTGANEGYRCQFLGSVTGGRGAVVMTNGDAGQAVVGRVLRAVAAAHGWSDLDFGRVYTPARAAEAFAGRYRARDGRAVEIVAAAGGPVLLVAGQEPLRCFALSEQELVAEELALAVRLDERGGVRLEQGGTVLEYARVGE